MRQQKHLDDTEVLISSDHVQKKRKKSSIRCNLQYLPLNQDILHLKRIHTQK